MHRATTNHWGFDMAKDYLWMRTPQHALDVIADLIKYQESVEEQDKWLDACIKLGFVTLEE